MSNKFEKKLSGKKIYEGVIVSLERDEVLLPNGNTSAREVIKHIGAAAVIPILDDGRVIMERQFRYAHGRVMLEIPAGKLDRARLNKIINPDMPSNYTSQQISDEIIKRKSNACASTRGMGVAVANTRR